MLVIAFVRNFDAPLSDGMRHVGVGDMGLIGLDTPAWRGVPRGRKSRLKAAVAHQRHLESLMLHGDLLPALPGTILPDGDIVPSLRANEAWLTHMLGGIAAHVQFQVTISCDADAGADRFRDAGSPLGPVTGAASFRTALAAHVQTALGAASAGLQELPIDGDMAVNLVALVARGAEAAFEAQVERIDAMWSDGLRLRQVGPAPASSFASFTLRRVARAELTAARRLLGVGAAATADDIATARRAALLRAGIDARAIRTAAGQLCAALAAGRPDGPFAEAIAWSEGRADPLAAARGEAA